MRQLKKLSLIFPLLLYVGVSLAGAAEGQRGINVLPNKVAPDGVPISGNYWALIIGIDQYKHTLKLETAVNDAVAIGKVLVERYGFRQDRVIHLLNEQATRQNIEGELYKLGRIVGGDDSVLIYYAGHGQYDEEGHLGWWVPVEAFPRDPGTFITNSSIRDYIQGMRARHVYLIADSCFSGTLLGTRSLPPLNDKFFTKLYAKRSRWGLTSGSTEPVADRGKDGHSLFAYFLLSLLKENTDPYLVPSHIYDRLAPIIANNADQIPRSEPLRGAGDEGGQFVFRLATDLPTPQEPSQPLTPLSPPQTAKAPTYSVPSVSQQLERKNLGKDNTLMLLIPAGEFTMGRMGSDDESPVHRVYLDSYYMDKYEVSVRQFRDFLSATDRAPSSTTWKNVSLEKDGDRPAAYMTWEEADASCRYYSKRLPTEAEWEKAGRGTDTRLYPWGNDPPTPQRANFDKCCDWKGYKILDVVTAYPDGVSPYGLHNMSGNVREWVADWYSGTYYAVSPPRNPKGADIGTRRVVRGGSWTNSKDYVRVTRRDTFPPDERSPTLGFRCAKSAQ